MLKHEIFACEECLSCHWYWENNDTGNECLGQEDKPCHEYIKEAEDGKRD